MHHTQCLILLLLVLSDMLKRNVGKYCMCVVVEIVLSRWVQNETPVSVCDYGKYHKRQIENRAVLFPLKCVLFCFLI